MKQLFSLVFVAIATLLSIASPVAQDVLDTIEVRIVDGFYQDIVEHIWTDTSGVLLLGTTTSPFEQWTVSGEPIPGKKWFLNAYDDSLNHQWFNVGVFQPEATTDWPIPPPTAIDLRGLVRGAMDAGLPTAWILSNQLPGANGGGSSGPQIGGWRAQFDRFSSEAAVASLNFEGLAALAGWSEAACLVQPAEEADSPTEPEEPLAWIIGTHYDWPYGVGQLFWAATDGAGFYDEQLVSAFDIAPFTGIADQGLRAVDASLYNDTLYIAATIEGDIARTAICVAARQNPGGISEDHTFEALSLYVFAQDSLTPAAIEAGPLGVVVSLNREVADGTNDFTLANLQKGSDGAAQSELGLAWMIAVSNDPTQRARDIVWADDQLVSASITEVYGAGGTGAMIEKYFHQNGSWYSGHTFGGEADEGVFTLKRDYAGRMLIGGWTKSYGDGASKAGWLVRFPSGNLAAAYEQTVDSLAIGYEPPLVVSINEISAISAGSVASIAPGLLPSPNPATRSQRVSWSLDASPYAAENAPTNWQLFDAKGKAVASGIDPSFSFAQFPQLQAGLYLLVSCGMSSRMVLLAD